MTRPKASWLFAATLAILLPLSLSQGQEGEGEGPAAASGAGETAGSGIKAVIFQVDGTKTEVEDIELHEEQLGIISITKVPVDAFKMKRGKAVITVNVRRIARIDILGETVRVTGREGAVVEGSPDKEGRFFILGHVSIGDFEIGMRDVKSVEFVHPDRKPLQCPSCRRYYDRDWKFCPYDGARLAPAE